MDRYKNLKSRRGLCIANILKVSGQKRSKVIQKSTKWIEIATYVVLGQTCSKLYKRVPTALSNLYQDTRL